MHLLVLAAAVYGSTASSHTFEPQPSPSVEPGQDCDWAKGRRVVSLGKVEPRKLGELPPGNLVLTVWRNVDGCSAPVIVRYGIGEHESAPVERSTKQRSSKRAARRR